MGITTSGSPGKGATTTLLSVVLDRRATESLARQLYLRIRDLTLSGQLTAGTRLPSTRRLAGDLGISRTVTLAAYDQLVVEGYLEARRGSGQYVRALNRTLKTRVRLGTPAKHVAPEADALAPRGRPFDPDAPPSTLFPTRVWARLMGRGWRLDGQAAVGLDQWAGLASLRAAIAEHLRALQGLECTSEHVAITAGNADALQIITRALTSRDAQIWVEDPGHVGARRTLAREGLKVVPVPVDAEGLDITVGRRLAPRARFALVTPSRQFPSGVPLSLSRRTALIDWAHESGAVVIADDYDSELRFSGRPMASLSSLDTRGDAVLTVGSFSKITFPGLRLGYVAGSPSLIDRLARARAREGAPVATGAQPALAEFIGGGGLSKHLRNLRRQITQWRHALTAALRERLGDAVKILPQEVGMHLTITLSDAVTSRLSDIEIAALAAARGLNLDPLSSHAVATPAHQGFLLGYAAWDEARLVAGVEALAHLLEDCDRIPASR
jgi:GntR family transcriptional regulator/MocR family aminotransferase